MTNILPADKSLLNAVESVSISNSDKSVFTVSENENTFRQKVINETINKTGD